MTQTITKPKPQVQKKPPINHFNWKMSFDEPFKKLCEALPPPWAFEHFRISLRNGPEWTNPCIVCKEMLGE